MIHENFRDFTDLPRYLQKPQRIQWAHCLKQDFQDFQEIVQDFQEVDQDFLINNFTMNS